MSDRLYERDYRAAISSIAHEALRLGKDDASPESVTDFVTESVRSSQWVIYTYRARHALLWSRNEDAIFDDFGTVECASTMLELYERAAFHAMLADVLDRMDELRDD